MFPLLFVLFVAIPIAEISVLLSVSDNIGGLNTLALVILTAVVGASLVKSQGLQTWMEVNRRMQQGELPGQQIAEGMMLLVAGVLLVTPGFITDLFGIIIVTPVFRPAIARYLIKHLNVRIVTAAQQRQNPYQQSPFQDEHSGQPREPNTLEGEFKRKDDE